MVLALAALLAALCLSHPAAAARALTQYSVNHDGGVVTPGMLQPGQLSPSGAAALAAAALADNKGAHLVRPEGLHKAYLDLDLSWQAKDYVAVMVRPAKESRRGEGWQVPHAGTPTRLCPCRGGSRGCDSGGGRRSERPVRAKL